MGAEHADWSGGHDDEIRFRTIRVHSFFCDYATNQVIFTNTFLFINEAHKYVKYFIDENDRAETMALMSSENEPFLERLNTFSAMNWAWKIYEFCAWNILPGASFCAVYRMGIQENSEGAVRSVVQQWNSMLTPYDYARGVLFMYDPSTFVVTVVALLKDEESHARLQTDGATNHLYLMLYHSGGTGMTAWSVEGYHLGCSFLGNIPIKGRE